LLLIFFSFLFFFFFAEESGWRPPKQSDEEYQTLQHTLKEVLRKIKDHPSAWPFLQPVDASEVPDYYEIIKDPIGMLFLSSFLFLSSPLSLFLLQRLMNYLLFWQTWKRLKRDFWLETIILQRKSLWRI
jgi:hypothetical protein